MSIRYCNSMFLIESNEMSYVMAVAASGHLEHLYFGEKLEGLDAFTGEEIKAALQEPLAFLPGNTINYSSEFPLLSLELLDQEVSSSGKGDVREPMIALQYGDGSQTSDFVYSSHEIVKGKPSRNQWSLYERLPEVAANESDAETLILTLKDLNSEVTLYLYYTVCAATDVLVRSAKLVNTGTQPITVNKLMSLQLDLKWHQMKVMHFSGAWAREMQTREFVHEGGIWQNSSRIGVSSSRKNPLVMLCRPETNEVSGECFALNLIYSGNHFTSIEEGSYGKYRLLSGVHPDSMRTVLAPEESFLTPEAIVCHSGKGLSHLSLKLHRFVKDHIVRGMWQYKERPVLINSWEAYYFDFNESKLLKLAKAARQTGVELFVLDDGWFGERNDDRRSLGDWTVNHKKLLNGLSGLAKKVNTLGMTFGIWVEPEMISRDSDLFRAHPEFALTIPNQAHSEGRCQMVLDMSRPEVLDYLYEGLFDLLNTAPIEYVKWDMNRIFTDVFSQGMAAHQQAALGHRYYLGLYSLLDRLTQAFPHVLLEGCASGGNRFDLGMLCYMPQIWASDNTDAYSRAGIQKGYSYGYPPSVMGAHVSAAPNHQTLRPMTLDTRFQVAAFGLLGYELDLTHLDKRTLKVITSQIEQYKLWRSVFQFGDFYRLQPDQNGSQGETWACLCVDSKASKAVLGVYAGIVEANRSQLTIKVPHLDPKARYKVYSLPNEIDIRTFGDLINQVSPVHLSNDSLVQHAVSKFYQIDEERLAIEVSGSLLALSGLKLPQGFCGMGHNESVRVFTDFSSRLYYIEKI